MANGYSMLSSSSEFIHLPSSHSTSSLLRLLHLCMASVMVLVALFGPAALQKGLMLSHPWFSENKSTFKLVTLAFNRTKASDWHMIAHNCAFLSRTNHTYFIHIDNTSHSFCERCNCVRFVPTNCTCPHPDAYNCALCEKLHFVIHALKQYNKIVFLDSDVILLRHDFMERLQSRAKHF